MTKRMIQYTVRAEQVAENERLIEAVFEELQRVQPPGLRYASMRVRDSGTFVHLVSYEGPDGENPLPSLPAFRAFVAGIRERCEAQPVTREWQVVGSYGLLEAAAMEKT